MLATVAALQLLALSQVPPLPREVTPEDASADEAAPPRPSGAAGADPSSSAPPARSGEPAGATPRQLSLLSAEPLGGGSASLAWVGWSSLGLMYGQGVTSRDDLAAIADFDWAKTELRVGGFYRRPLGQAGDFDMAGRLAATWYQSFGADYIHDENHSDRGVEVVPGLSFSTRGAGGIFSAIAEAPLTITMKYGSGLLFSPRLSLAYEGLLYPDVTLGARLGVGYRAGSGDAPLKEGRAELLFLLVAGYQLL
jgi:hypothetical protein